MSEPKRHHYIPRFYLEGFRPDSEEYLHVFDREKSELRKQTPLNTMVSKYYYSFEDVDGSKNTEIESSVLRIVERVAKQVIDRLNNRESICLEERLDFALFVAFMMNRTPDFERSLNTVTSGIIKKITSIGTSNDEWFTQFADSYKKDTDKEFNLTAEELNNLIQNSRLELHPNMRLWYMLELSQTMSNYFSQMNWAVLHCPDNCSFVTTDQPFTVVDTKSSTRGFFGAGLIDDDVKKIIPLSKKTCLEMLDHGNSITHHDIDDELVRQINLTVAVGSDRYVIGDSRSLLSGIASEIQSFERRDKGSIRLD